ncbi:MAG TPA: UrcA family protein [Steroidobacteraceae bacterium]
MTTSIAKTITVLTLTASFLGVSSLALADQAATARSGESAMRIGFSDLDLSKTDDVAELYARIKNGARLVCVDSSSPWDAKRTESIKRCYSAVLDDAVAQINQPKLTALHQQKNAPVLVGSVTK